jgi:hypothetical protein
VIDKRRCGAPFRHRPPTRWPEVVTFLPIHFSLRSIYDHPSRRITVAGAHVTRARWASRALPFLAHTVSSDIHFCPARVGGFPENAALPTPCPLSPSPLPSRRHVLSCRRRKCAGSSFLTERLGAAAGDAESSFLFYS